MLNSREYDYKWHRKKKAIANKLLIVEKVGLENMIRHTKAQSDYAIRLLMIDSYTQVTEISGIIKSIFAREKKREMLYSN